MLNSSVSLPVPTPALVHACTELGRATDLDLALETVCASAAELAGAEHAAVLLLSSVGATGTVQAEYPARGMLRRTVAVRETPLLRRLISTRAPVQAGDALADDEVGEARAYLKQAGTRALLAVPICRGERVWGWLSIHSGEVRRSFSEAAVGGCVALADMVGLALENATLLESRQAHARELKSLREASLNITSLLEMDESGSDDLLRRIVEQAVHALPGQSSGIYRLTGQDELLLMADYCHPEHRGKTLRLGEGMAGNLVLSGAEYVAERDYRKSPQRASIFDGSNVGSVLEVPLRWHGRVTGVLYVNDAAGREFTPADAARLGILADSAALVLAHLEQREHGEAHGALSVASDGEELTRVAHRILSDLGVTALDEHLSLIAREAAGVLNAELCQVLLVSRPGVLTLESSWGHCPGTFERREFEIRSGPRTGLTGHIAHELKVFRGHGEALTGHFAVRGLKNEHLPSGHCSSLLAVPLVKSSSEGKTLLGLLRLENKKNDFGAVSPDVAFDEADERTAQLLADVVVSAIDNAALVRQLREQGEADARRKHLLTRMFDILKEMHGERDTAEFRQEIPLRAMQLLGYHAACLYDYDPALQHVVVVGVAGLPPSARGDREREQAGLPGRVACREQTLVHLAEPGRTEPYTVHGQTFEFAIGAPLRRSGGAVASVLVVAEHSPRGRFAEIDREVLELFASQAATLLQSSVLWSWERRSFMRASALGRLEEFIRRTSEPDKILAAMLTGMTAGYGLGFNRAAVFLFHDRLYLEGRLAIGALTEEEARGAWERHHAEGMESVGRYLERLEDYGHDESPLNSRVREVRVTAGADLMLLLTAVEEGRVVIDTHEELDALPVEIIAAFRPRLPLILVPIAVGREILGFVMADTAFVRKRAWLEDLDGAVRLASNAAAALLAAPGPWSVFRKDQLETLDAIGADIPAEADPLRTVRQQIVSAARHVFDASSAVLWTFDAHTRRFTVRECAGNIAPSLRARLQQQPPQEGGTAFTVLERGWVPVDDLDGDEDHPFLSSSTREILRDLGARSLQGVSLTLANEQLGVVYLHYTAPNKFGPDDMQSAAQFADHAALALKQAQMLDQVTRARRTARTLAKVGTVGDRERFSDVLKTIAEETLRALQCDVVTLYEYEPDTLRLLNPPATAGVVDVPPLAWHPQVPETSFLYKMLWDNRPRLVEDAAADPDLGPTRFRREEGIMSCAVVPLVVRGQRVGLMFVNYTMPHRFTRDEQDNLELFADQAAVCIHNAQLYRQLKRSSRERQTAAAMKTIDIVERQWRHKVFKFAPVIEAWVDVGRKELDDGMQAGTLDRAFGVHLHSLLNDFLTRTVTAISERPVRVRPEQSLESVRINALIRKAMETWRTRDAADVTLRLVDGAADTDAVRANREWLLAMFDTLVENALEAMAETEVRVLTVETRRTGNVVEIEVTDTGRGVEPERRARLLSEPVSTLAEGKGMGIGLSIVEGIALTYGGQLELADPPAGPGTLVRVTLPLYTGNGEFSFAIAEG